MRYCRDCVLLFACHVRVVLCIIEEKRRNGTHRGGRKFRPEKGMASMQDYLRIKERQTFCAAPAQDCGKSYSVRAGSLSCTRTVSCWNFWGWTLRRHRRSATRYGITESRMNTKELCRRPCPRRLPVPGQRCRKSSINGTIPCGGLYPCGAAA